MRINLLSVIDFRNSENTDFYFSEGYFFQKVTTFTLQFFKL